MKKVRGTVALQKAHVGELEPSGYRDDDDDDDGGDDVGVCEGGDSDDDKVRRR